VLVWKELVKLVCFYCTVLKQQQQQKMIGGGKKNTSIAYPGASRNCELFWVPCHHARFLTLWGFHRCIWCYKTGDHGKDGVRRGGPILFPLFACRVPTNVTRSWRVCVQKAVDTIYCAQPSGLPLCSHLNYSFPVNWEVSASSASQLHFL